jgi:hypothetical protein
VTINLSGLNLPRRALWSCSLREFDIKKEKTDHRRKLENAKTVVEALDLVRGPDVAGALVDGAALEARSFA